MKSYITIDEILNRKHFVQTEVIAGAKGLYRQLKWVHIVESIQISNLLNGHELILTTGLGFRDDPHHFVFFLEQLIERQTAGLCIEMGTHIHSIPEEVIKLANHHHFPIILFHQEVPFVEITQDVHSLIINKQYQLLTDLENYSQQLNKMLLEIEDDQQILKFLQSYLEVQVIAVLSGNKADFYPELKGNEKEELLMKIKNADIGIKTNIASQPVQILGETYAELLIISKCRDLNEFDLLILDRTVNAFAQHLLRDLYVKEKKMAEESEWLTNWLEGEYTDEVIREQLSFIDPNLRLNGGAVCICKLMPDSSAHSPNVDGTYFKLLFRTVFEQFGFHLFTVEVRHHLIFIVGNKRNKKDWKERMNQAFLRIHSGNGSERLRNSSISIGVGKFADKLGSIHQSYQTAKETLALQDSLCNEGKSYFYQDLHMYRMMSLLKKHGNLEETIHEYLAPVIEYDLKYNGDMMLTLKTYLACNGSKQETSKKLFIVRQTLYHRIEKLELLLGENFMSSDRRLALEFMLMAHDFIIKTEGTIPLQQKIE
ncbi:PucR family transcriptional regulator [Metabacillus idriensis]|uniref:PucR family transcriptional regulator n=1 Tax=Metabacillus idriensis TaxID=324768 RepID=UPI00174C285E|nr:PucR family transcriptional regulator ligand-binding domain-containing protein [Metabacillus idriensis]